MKKNLFAIFVILTLVIIWLSGCGLSDENYKDNEKSKENEQSLTVNLDDIQSDFETIISNIQNDFIKIESNNPEANLSEYITFEKLDIALKKYGYNICLENDKSDKPTDMSELVTNKNLIYLSKDDNIFKVNISKSDNVDDRFIVITSDVELVK